MPLLLAFVFIIPLGPWQREPENKPPLPFQFSLTEIYCLLALTLAFTSMRYRPNMRLIEFLPPVLGAIIIWTMAVLALNRHRVTNVKRRVVTCLITFPLGVFSGPIFLFGLIYVAYFIYLDGFGKTISAIEVLIAAALVNFIVRRLSWWALSAPTTQFLNSGLTTQDTKPETS